MLKTIKSILTHESHCLKAPEFCFEMTLEVAEKNFLVLKRHDFDLGKAITAQLNSPVGYSPLLGNHPIWPMIKSILKNGTQWPTDPISEEERIGDVKEALKFGNHKGAKSHP